MPFFGTGMKTDLSSPVATAEFSKFAGVLSEALLQHHLLGFEISRIKKDVYPKICLFDHMGLKCKSRT